MFHSCIRTANASQLDTDGDGFGDACDGDDDGDGIGDAGDLDNDNDGVVDGSDSCLGTTPGDVVDATGAGADLAEQALAGDPDRVRTFDTWCEEHLFGRPSIHELTGRAGSVRAPDLEGGTARMIASSRQIAPFLDGIASSLTRAGSDSFRLPPDSRDGIEWCPTRLHEHPKTREHAWRGCIVGRSRQLMNCPG